MPLRFQEESGQGTVELALGATFFLLMMIVAADFARGFFMSIEVANAARAGVQYGSQNRNMAADTSGIQIAAQNDASNISGLTATPSVFCQCAGVTVACSPPQCSSPITYVQVVASATYTTMLNYPMVPHSIPMTSTAIMEVQN